MIVAGVGSRRGVSAEEVRAAIEGALERFGASLDDVSMLATPAIKGGEAGIARAAAELVLPLILVPQAQLEAAGARAISRSERVVALLGVPSAAETAALAAAGAGGRLLGPRFVLGPVTCALARRGGSEEAAP
ncbi:cobalamin biosynthesis protein [Ancylobacter terrae]|uniref:cobalamin biosynthesis protein n=1 Tax=Ancylobacter sp. sgz301288 TaxID=3342077 RepID=UPI00385CE8E7